MKIPFLRRKSKESPPRRVSELGRIRGGERISSTRQPWMLLSRDKQEKQRKAETQEELRKSRERRQAISTFRDLPRAGGFSLPELKLSYLIPVVLFPLVFGFIFFLYDSEVFVVSQIEIVGNEEISDLQVIGVVGDLKGESMLLIQGGDLERELSQSFPYIKEVYVDKVLPGKVLITIEERFPEFAYANLSGAYLVDSEQVVVEILGVDERHELLDHEKLILDGYGDIEADYVFSEYISDIEDDEDLKKVDWEEVEEEDKQAALRKLRRGLRQTVDALHDEKLEFIQRAGFAELNIAYGFDVKTYEVGDTFPIQMREYSEEIQRYLDNEKIPLRRLLWRSDFTIQADILSNTKLLFTSTRSLQEQLDTFQALRASTKIKKANVIDLRSEIIAVK